jgi:pimeloyl-ACP methyl ester carboxylesterase
MEKFIMPDGCALRVRDGGGEGPAVVLLHGYLETIEVWEEFIPLLKGVRVVAVDLPGHGVSEVKGPVHTMEFLARTAHAALGVLGIEKAFVVGHSMGGYAALEFLRLFPEATLGLVLLHSTPNADTPEKIEQRERAIALVEAGKKELIARMNSASGFAPENRRKFAGWIEEMYEMATLEEDEGIVALLRGMIARPDYNDMLRASGVPRLFIFGHGDEHIPLPAAEALAAAHPRAQVVWLEHAGHMGFVEQPQDTADAILNFIKENERP